MNTLELICGLINIILSVIGFYYIITENENLDKKSKIWSSIFSIFFIQAVYWGSGTYNIIDSHDLIFLVFTNVVNKLFSTLNNNNIKYSRIYHLMFGCISMYLLYLAGGYDAVFKFFHFVI